ncbi:tyrosine recombinase XerC [Amycolatopsis sp. FDAARGOS 1241]|uniref:site-specific integrase n=1 Tax=Amycolatopsis sp. FDAARGOS 1241 TaxID=2778070 RepID=UPI001EF3586E|nr:tyrosine-type recombinase/integrase [Amycolatopsis sp. FDAARGOS 1241]
MWKLETRLNAAKKVTSYRVLWQVEQEVFKESFKLYAQADGHRSSLLAAQRAGEAFDLVSGLPPSMLRPKGDLSWYRFTEEYIDMKWPDAAATARQTMAEALIRVMPVFVKEGKNEPDAKVVRSALRQWGYNTEYRNGHDMPADVRKVLEWLARNTLSVKAVSDPDILRALQRAVTRRLDGKRFAPSVARKTRGVLFNALDYAIEKKLIDANPLSSVKWTAMPKGKRKVDKRAVPNPVQARTLLAAVGALPRSGPRLEAFFGAMYYAGLRPEEAVSLNKRNLSSLPEPVWNEQTQEYVYDWGEFHLEKAEPHAGGRWTNTGRPRDERPLKSRGDDEGRPVSFPPDLTRLLWRHIRTFGFGPDGRLFCAERGGEIPMITYTRAWRAARKAALTEEVQATPLAARPYDLRHAAVSTRLAAGVDPAEVAAWAGHSVGVLMEVYATFLDGGEAANRARIEKILGHQPRGRLPEQ